MRQCRKCGGWIEEEANFCTVCGAKQEQVYQAEVPGYEQNASAGKGMPDALHDLYGDSTPKHENGYGITGFVLGIVGLCFSCCAWFGTVLAIAGLIFSIVGLVTFSPDRHPNKGLAIAGLVLNGITLLFGLLMIPFWGTWFDQMWEYFYYL